MRKWLILIALLCAPVFAEEVPYILGYVNNKDGGKIVFTSIVSDCKDSRKLVFIRDNGGRISLRGCYLSDNTFLVVQWEDGSVYTYDWDGFIVSDEFQKYMKRNGS